MKACLQLHFFLKGVATIKPQNQNSETVMNGLNIWEKYLYGQGKEERLKHIHTHSLGLFE